MDIGFIGAGNMAFAIIGGILNTPAFSKHYPQTAIMASDPQAETRAQIKQRYPQLTTTADNRSLVQNSEIIILAVKPQQMETVLREIGNNVREKLVISIAAGITIQRLQSKLLKARIARIMPNTPCLVSAGMSALSFADNVTDEDKQCVEAIFSAVGETTIVDESLINAVTGVSGSGPAFVYDVAQALIDGAVSVGLEAPVARKLVAQTLAGAGQMLLQRPESPAELIRMVASPGGTTEAGLTILSREKWRHVLKNAVIAAKERTDELSKE